jgi:predicted nucleotidyltransferase
MAEDKENRFGLSERSIKTLTDIFSKYPEVTEVRLFGSRAKGNYQSSSDIDLAVMNEGVSSGILARIISDFEESSLPHNVDVANYPALKLPEFINHIKRVGVVFYRKSPL